MCLGRCRRTAESNLAFDFQLILEKEGVKSKRVSVGGAGDSINVLDESASVSILAKLSKGP